MHGGAPSLQKLGLLSRMASLRAYVSPGPPSETRVVGAYVSSGPEPSPCLLLGGGSCHYGSPTGVGFKVGLEMTMFRPILRFGLLELF